MTREQAWELLCEFVGADALRKHNMAVEAAMRHYAVILGGDVEQWGIAGLLHDFDYERWPNPPDHTREGAKVLRERGVDEEIVGAVLSHVDYNQDEYARDRPIRRALAAVDELSSFIVACALVRPTRLEGLTPKSVKKKMKASAFAAAVNRDDIRAGAELLGIPLDEHISNCIAALEPVAANLGLSLE
ncbi:MAG: HDIG domain-containing metalloprotein [Planctomycetota bacterium]